MKDPVLRADKNVIIVAIVLSAAGHAVAQSPTADDPILYVQILRAGSHSAQTWWPYNDADEWDPNIVPMVPLNALSYPHAAPLADYNNDELVTSDDALTFLADFVEQID